VKILQKNGMSYLHAGPALLERNLRRILHVGDYRENLSAPFHPTIFLLCGFIGVLGEKGD